MGETNGSMVLASTSMQVPLILPSSGRAYSGQSVQDSERAWVLHRAAGNAGVPILSAITEIILRISRMGADLTMVRLGVLMFVVFEAVREHGDF